MNANPIAIEPTPRVAKTSAGLTEGENDSRDNQQAEHNGCPASEAGKKDSEVRAPLAAEDLEHGVPGRPGNC